MQTLPVEVEALIGEPLYPEKSDFTVTLGDIRNACAAVQNGNPLYWDETVAETLTGGQIAPPTMLSAWVRPYHWRPDAGDDYIALQAHFDLKRLLELPEAVITANQLRFGEAVRLGDQLSSYQVVRSISDVKQTKLGHGRFWVIDVVYENQRGQDVGTDSYTAFGYVKEQT